MAVGEKFPVVMGVEKAANNGVATLDAKGILVEDQWPEKIKWQSGENLLQNWYFIGGGSQQGGGQFPINQRGETEYLLSSFGYTIDRWEIRHSVTAVRIKPDCIEFEQRNNLHQAGIFQPIENFDQFVGKELTFSVIAKGDGINPPKISTMRSEHTIIGSPSTDWQLITVTYTPSSSDDIPRIYATINDNNHPIIGLRAAKLELGPVQTLAHQDASGNWVLNDPPPNFQQELAKCQRYFLPGDLYAPIIWGHLENACSYFLNTPVTMRCDPTVIGTALAIRDGVLQWQALDKSKIQFQQKPGGFYIYAHPGSGVERSTDRALYISKDEGGGISCDL